MDKMFETITYTTTTFTIISICLTFFGEQKRPSAIILELPTTTTTIYCSTVILRFV